MKAISDHSFIIECSGRELDAIERSVGCDPEAQCVYTGFDDRWSKRAEHCPDMLTPQERVEIADYMIDQWELFRAAAELELANE